MLNIEKLAFCVQMCPISFDLDKKKNLQVLKFNYSQILFSAQNRGRTGTGVTPLVFETNASADSAIWAKCFLRQMRRKSTIKNEKRKEFDKKMHLLRVFFVFFLHDKIGMPIFDGSKFDKMFNPLN